MIIQTRTVSLSENNGAQNNSERRLGKDHSLRALRAELAADPAEPEEDHFVGL